MDHHSINAGIVRGLASFDTHVLLGLPTEQATYCLAALYQSFSLRGWLEGSTEDDCRDEYVEFADHFRDRYASLKDSPEGFTDMVDLLSQMPELGSRHHLYRLFRLSCLCLTEDTDMLPPIRFQDVDAQSPQCRLGDVLMPAQSYLARVPDAINVCNNEDALIKHRELEAQFNSGNVAADPWSHVDAFGRAGIHKALQSTYKTLFQLPESASSSRFGSRSSSPATGGRRKTSPGKGKRKFPLMVLEFRKGVKTIGSLDQKSLNLECTYCTSVFQSVILYLVINCLMSFLVNISFCKLFFGQWVSFCCLHSIYMNDSQSE